MQNSTNKFTPKNPQQSTYHRPSPNTGSLQKNYNYNQASTSNEQFNQRNSIKTCRYCKKTGHLIDECRKRIYNNNKNNNNDNRYDKQNQGNRQIPERNGATSGKLNTRPTQVISAEKDTNIEQ